MQFSEIFTAKRCVHRIKALYLFNLKCDRFLTTAIFSDSASTVHNSLKIMFENFTFWCNPGYDTCLSVLHIPFLE